MDLQWGVEVYQFVRDRQDDLRDERHPEGHDDYLQAWRDAHDLHQGYADAVSGGDFDDASRLLAELTDMADLWRGHPQYPVRSVSAAVAHASVSRNP